MTATEKLRRMLDEHGVPWRCYGHENHTWWGEWHAENRASVNGLFLKVEGVVTPEQAIVATVGARTCRFIDDSNGEFPPKCSACGYEPSIYECSWLIDGGYEYDGNYCANCGARVEGDDR